MSWEDIVKFERNPYSDGKSYVKQIEQIEEDIKKVIEYLESEPETVQLHSLTPFYAQGEYDLDNQIQLAIEMLKEINTKVD